MPLTGNAVSSYLWYVYELDYTTKAYNFFLDGVLIANSIPFLDSSTTQFTEFKLGSDGKDDVYFDDFRVSYDAPAGLDHDGDGLLTSAEDVNGNGVVDAGETDFMSTDTDSDSINDLYEVTHGLNPLLDDSNGDADSDTLSNLLEYQLGSDINSADSDSDTYGDLDEYYAQTGIADAGSFPDTIGIAPWQTSTLGNIFESKSYGVNGNLVLIAGGTGLSLNDKMGLFHQSVSSDFSLAVRVHSISGGGDGYIGLIARETSAVDAPYATIYTGKNDGIYFMHRAASGQYGIFEGYQERHETFPNYWMKIERRGNSITGYSSGDGNSWHARGSQTLNLGSSTKLGFFLYSGDDTIWNRAVIEIVGFKIDEDRDGLWSDEELALGTDDSIADTDGDGVDDYTEVKVTFTNPLVAEFDGTVTSVVSASGSSYVDSSGDWLKDGSEVYARSQRGWIEYDITLPGSGTFRLDLSGGQENAYSSEDRFDIALYVDGQWVGREVLEAAYPNLGTISFYLSSLDSGTHKFRIEWINGEPQTSLKITDLNVVELGGVDLNTNGVPDWVESRINSTSSLDTTTVQTLVSPYTIEGQSLFVEAVEVVGSYDPDPANPQAILTNQGLQGSYFAHVPLAPDADTTITVNDQGGLFQSQKTVTWEATNVLEVSDFKIRTGDSLLLAGFDSANSGASDPVVITIDDSSGTQIASYSINSDEAVAHEFDLPDTYELTATLTPATGAPLNATISVDVVGVNFGTPPRVIVGETRQWTVSNLSEEIFMEADASLYLEETTYASSIDRTFNLSTSSGDESTILARLGENGPIIKRVSVFPLIDYHYTQTKWDVVDTFSDGTSLWSVSINLGGVISDDLEIHLNIFKAGVTFLDGTVSKVITAADLDELGTYRYYMLNPPNTEGSTCHSVTIFQGDQQIANAY